MVKDRTNFQQDLPHFLTNSYLKLYARARTHSPRAHYAARTITRVPHTRPPAGAECARELRDPAALVEMVVAIGNWTMFAQLLRSLAESGITFNDLNTMQSSWRGACGSPRGR